MVTILKMLLSSGAFLDYCNLNQASPVYPLEGLFIQAGTTPPGSQIRSNI
jgi:hypothetical protein